METIRGKTCFEVTASEFGQRLESYEQILLDLGTGDGHYVRHMAERHPDWFFIGVDTCRENLYTNSRRKLPNTLFVIASAQDLPQELNGLVSHITINFPWGSLLESLLKDDDVLIRRLTSMARPCADMDIHLNGEALAMLGRKLESGMNQIEQGLSAEGWKTRSCSWMDAHLLRSFPTTWAKRLAFGRDPRAIRLSVRREE